MNSILIASIVTLVIGALAGVLIGLAAKFFQVKSDPKIQLVLELLPGANCGGCGKAGCADFAKAVVNGELTPGKCAVCSREVVATIARTLGIEMGNEVRQKAVVLCGGDRNQVRQHILYNGILDCVSASLVAGGPKGCSYGCLGMGSCARSCPFGAIEIINNLAVVHPELCVGCGTCVAVCPRNLIKLVPVDAKVHVYCSSPEKGPLKKQYCNVPCIGCRKCMKVAGDGQIEPKGFRLEINYSGESFVDENTVFAAGCPTGALLSEAEHLRIERNEQLEREQA